MKYKDNLLKIVTTSNDKISEYSIKHIYFYAQQEYNSL